MTLKDFTNNIARKLGLPHEVPLDLAAGSLPRLDQLDAAHCALEHLAKSGESFGATLALKALDSYYGAIKLFDGKNRFALFKVAKNACHDGRDECKKLRESSASNFKGSERKIYRDIIWQINDLFANIEYGCTRALGSKNAENVVATKLQFAVENAIAAEQLFLELSYSAPSYVRGKRESQC